MSLASSKTRGSDLEKLTLTFSHELALISYLTLFVRYRRQIYFDSRFYFNVFVNIPAKRRLKDVGSGRGSPSSIRAWSRRR